MIIIALGSNQSGPWGTPEQSVHRALDALNTGPIKVMRVSTLIRTAPFGNKNQPDFINAVAIVTTHLPPSGLIRRLHFIERQAGRKRGRRWGPRTLDLDIIDYHGRIISLKSFVQRALVLPHPGIAVRSFVLAPIAEIAPRWHHPLNHLSAASMIQKL